MKKTKTKIKTFRTLLIEDNMRIKDLAQLVEVNGTLYINKWGEWKASLPGNAKTKDVIDAALDALADYVSAEITRDSQRVEEFYDRYTHHPLDNFGFTIGDNNELFIELVNGKAIDRKQASKKVKRKKPHSSTDRGRLDDFKNDKFIPLVEQVLKKNPDWQNRQILADKKVADALDTCGFPEGKPSKKAIKDWIRIARINTGAKAKIGRPPN